MFRFGGAIHRSQRVTRTVLWAVLACSVSAVASSAGEPTSPAANARLAEKVKVRRQLRAAERLAMAPRAARPIAAAPRVADKPVAVASAAPSATQAPAERSARLFDAKDAATVDGSAAARSNAAACVVTGRALLGEPQLARFARRIGEVDVERCFEAIPAWRTIKQEELRSTRARYHFLMRQANVDLQRAIAAAAAQRGVTLVVERGGIQNAGDKAVDLTQSVLDALKSAP
ncbi:MAG: hypothetical protein JNL94_10840 [Planctomycetes bacterium]|nr:hypothetical protein [Planctomycetota bacterium]